MLKGKIDVLNRQLAAPTDTFRASDEGLTAEDIPFLLQLQGCSGERPAGPLLGGSIAVIRNSDRCGQTPGQPDL